MREACWGDIAIHPLSSDFKLEIQVVIARLVPNEVRELIKQSAKIESPLEIPSVQIVPQSGMMRGRRNTTMNDKTIIPSEVIEKRIFLIRGQKVMLDRHLAELYGVPTMRLNEAVKRNTKRFPPDFMFQLSVDENDTLISQFAISKGRGGHRKLPFVFTEQGIAMLSSVLKSDRAVLVNFEIMRAFVKLRQLLSTHKDLAAKLEELEKKYDAQFKVVFDATRQIIYTPEKPKREIGFRVKEPAVKYGVKRQK